MTRRSGDRRVGRGASSARSLSQLTAQVIRSLNGGAMFEATYYNTSAGNVTAFIDRTDPTHLLTITGTLSNPTANAAYGSAVTAAFTGAQYGDSNRAVGYWTGLSRGDGMDVVALLTPKDAGGTNRYNTVLGNCNIGLLESGISLSFYGTALEDSGFVVCANNAGGRAVDQNGGAVTANTATYLRWTYVEGGSPNEWQYYNKTAVVASGNTTVSPSAIPPVFALRMGARPDGAAGMIADFRGLYIKPGRFTTQELANLQVYIALTTGNV